MPSLLKRIVSTIIPSPIKINFRKGGGSQIKEVEPYPSNLIDPNVEVHTSENGIEFVRTPDERFNNLTDYTFEPNYVEVNSLRMHYLDEGPKDGEIILLLHGQPTWSFLYRKMINVLAPKGYRCIAPDMIGMGKSDKPIKEAYHTYDQHCADILEFIQSMKLNNITAFIQDWGSVIGTRLVGENPNLFSRVILANGDLPSFTEKSNPFYIPNPIVVNPSINSPQSAMAKYSLKGLAFWFQSWILYCLQNTKPFVGKVMRMALENPTDDVIAGYDAPFPSFIYMAGPRTLPSMNAGIRGQQLDAWESLKSFDKPFLSLIGLKDRLLGRRSIQKKWISVVPGAKGQNHEQFENANHFIQEDIGEIMADRVDKFVKSNS